MRASPTVVLLTAALAATLGCGGQPATGPPAPSGAPTLAPVAPVPAGAPLSIVGGVAGVTDRLLTEIAARGDYAYTGTNPRSGSGSCGLTMPCTTMLRVWDLRPDTPRPIGDVALDGIFARDAAVSDDGRLLMVPTEGSPTSGIYLFDLSDPGQPRMLSRFVTNSGVHTAKFGRVGGVLHAFLAVNRGTGPGGVLIEALCVRGPRRRDFPGSPSRSGAWCCRARTSTRRTGSTGSGGCRHSPTESVMIRAVPPAGAP